MLYKVTPASGVLTDLLPNGEAGASADINARGYHYLLLTIVNPAGAALADFAVLGRPDSDASYQTIISGASWASGHSLVPFVTRDDLNALPAEQIVMVQILIGGFKDIKLQASSASGAGGELSVYVNLSQ